MRTIPVHWPLRPRWLTWLGLTALSAAIFLSAQNVCTAEKTSSYETDLAAFLKEVDSTYPFLDLKGIRDDWAAAKRGLSEKAKTCRSNTEFLGIVVEAVRCLRDPHITFQNLKARIPAMPAKYYPGISFLPAEKKRVVVMYPPRGHEKTLKTGALVTKIDGKDARVFLEDRARQAWASGGFFSSPQRARLFEFRISLRGKEGEKHTVTYLSGEEEPELVLTCNVEARGWPHTYNLPSGLTRVGRSFFHAKLAGGAGYMYIRRVDDSVEPGITEALEKHSDAAGWIIDLCGNGGGGYGASLIQKIKALPRPVAVIIDAGCASAGETLARDIARYAGARLFGSRTAGSSSSKRLWPFPSGIASVVFPTRSRWRADGKPIEFNGIEPDEEVEVIPEEVARGLNSAIRRAEEYLKKKQSKLVTDVGAGPPKE